MFNLKIDTAFQPYSGEKYEFIDKALIEIFGELSSNPLRSILEKLNISIKFSDYNISRKELEELKNSLINNQRASNSLTDLELN